MNKITLKSSLEAQRYLLNTPLINYNLKEFLIKERYILSIIRNERQIKKLGLKDTLIARINSFPNKYIGYEIKNRLEEQDKSAYKIMKEEIIRLDILTNNYKNKRIIMLKQTEMKNIMTKYLKEETVEELLNNLYSFIEPIADNSKNTKTKTK